MTRFLWIGLLMMTPAVWAAESETTITSDQLELVDHGETTLFTGHVLMKDGPNTIAGDKMVRTKATGVVQGYGNIVGTWISDKGEKVVATGERATYDPRAQTTELWKKARVTRWQTISDTAPVVITADRFIAQHAEEVVWAKKHVIVKQTDSFWSSSEQGKFDRSTQLLHLWSNSRSTRVKFKQSQGSGDFVSRRALVDLQKKKMRLLDDVKGHIVPSTL